MGLSMGLGMGLRIGPAGLMAMGRNLYAEYPEQIYEEAPQQQPAGPQGEMA